MNFIAFILFLWKVIMMIFHEFSMTQGGEEHDVLEENHLVQDLLRAPTPTHSTEGSAPEAASAVRCDFEALRSSLLIPPFPSVPLFLGALGGSGTKFFEGFE